MTHALQVNTAVEESTLGQRKSSLLPADDFVRTHVSELDTIVVSVGGNDVALRPTLSTIISMLMLPSMPLWLIESGNAPGMGHFVNLFRERTMAYVHKLIALRKPRRVVVCTLYFLDEVAGGSWADFVLEKLGYNKNPEKLQAAIIKIHELAHSTIKDVGGVEVVAVPFFSALDGKDTHDYCQRVEPSVQGGSKMAKLIVDAVLAQRPADGWPGERAPRAYSGSHAPWIC